MKTLLLLLLSACLVTRSFAAQKVYALIIGMDSVDDAVYQVQFHKTYSQNAVAGVWRDVATIKNILSPYNYLVTELRAEEATHQKILAEITRIGRIIKPGDQFVFYYSGHGDVLPDVNGDEASGFDQVLVAYDKYVVDDEINLLLRQFFTQTVNCFIIDACHSGTIYKMNTFFMDFKQKTGKVKFANEKLAKKQEAEFVDCSFDPVIAEPYHLIYFGATADSDLAIGQSNGGLLTLSLESVVNTARATGQWNGYDYRKLACLLKSKMAPFHQELQYHEIGIGTDELANHTPFKPY